MYAAFQRELDELKKVEGARQVVSFMVGQIVTVFDVWCQHCGPALLCFHLRLSVDAKL